MAYLGVARATSFCVKILRTFCAPLPPIIGKLHRYIAIIHIILLKMAKIAIF